MRRIALVAAVLPLLTGCGEQHFRAETVWHDDGRVDRAVYQPADYFPGEARTGWTSFRPAAEIQTHAFTGSIRDLPAASSDPPYFAAHGTFLSPEQIPDHFAFPASDPSKAGRLIRTAEVRRLGFVTEYLWRETLADVVSLPDMQAARHELIAHAADLVEATLRDGTLKHDINGLLRWIRVDAATWLDELHATLVEAMLRREQHIDSGKAVARRLAEVCARYGLELRSPDGSLIEGNAIDEVLERFLVAKVRETVRTPEGDHVDDATARDILRRLGFIANDDGLSWQPNENVLRAVKDRFGSEEAAQAKANELGTRLLGAYHMGMLSPPRPFRYELSVPGVIVETTGERVSDNRVRWRFDAVDAFPLGYDMTVRSLAPNVAAQKAAWGTTRIASLDELTEYAALLREDTNLAAVMADSARTGSLKPFNDYASALEPDADAAIRNRLASMRRLMAE